jgi:ATP-dependent helicase/nuclease subunit A
MSSQEQLRPLDPEQVVAAHTLDRHVSVTAGPGSGKTTVLVERYLHILRQHKEIGIDNLVAITFTNRAANEMRERLRKEFDQILRETTGAERQHWMRHKRTLDGAVITTIHGFCSRLLREFPVEAGIDPQFTLLDEHRAALLLESVVEEALTEFISSGHTEISKLTLGVGRGKLASALVQLYRDVRGQGLSFDELARQTANTHAGEAERRSAVAKLSECVAAFLGERRTTPKARGSQAEVSSEWRLLLPHIEKIPDEESLADFCRLIEGFRKVRPSKSGSLAGHIDALDELIWAKEFGGNVPQICFDAFAKHYALEVIEVLQNIDARLEAEKQKLSAVDFDDLQLRALKLLERQEVLARASQRYRFFLVDEFQDTNGLQRDLMTRLALGEEKTRTGANLFIVGDRKQSIYGFRGADVDVFGEMTEALVAKGGVDLPLHLNFRSQPPLIDFFNYLFARLFQPSDEAKQEDLGELGYVEHERSAAKRKPRDPAPLVELLVSTTSPEEKKEDTRERDAQQLAARISSLAGSAGIPPASNGVTSQEGDERVNSNNYAPSVEGGRDARDPSNRLHSNGRPSVQFRDIALLFRAMTDVPTYEAAFRRANIPYQTIQGKGFYDREEITDLIQLLRFLDNKTDELALAAVLRSPLCGISDNALLALRCAPWIDETDGEKRLRHFSQTRKLFYALRRHDRIAFIADEEHALLDQALAFINSLIERRSHYTLSDLLRFAVERSEYQTVIAATFDGAQRLANVQKLFRLAERFEHSGAHLIRDFVQYVEEFEALGSRESEGQIDESANAVKLMTIHQAKGLEFPIVIIPDLQRLTNVADSWYLLDRRRGLTMKIPDGRGKQVTGLTFARFSERAKLREQFESMRLLYVAFTRAQDRLILSGAIKGLGDLKYRKDSWLAQIWQAVGLKENIRTGVHAIDKNVDLKVILNGEGIPRSSVESMTTGTKNVTATTDPSRSLLDFFPLLAPLEPDLAATVGRFSVTQLINYRRCPRQYYFDRVLHVPTSDELNVWNDAEAPEPPANLTATMKGAVIHRFCETFCPGDDPVARLRQSLEDLIRLRQAQFADRLLDTDTEEAVKELLPLAEHYLSSDVFQRINDARAGCSKTKASWPTNDTGLWSELNFRLRRPLGVLTGAIDMLLITPASAGGLNIEVIDFKTNRFRASSINHSKAPRAQAQASSLGPRARRPPAPAVAQHRGQQIAFDFSATKQAGHAAADSKPEPPPLSVQHEIARVAADYQLQMQAYALAVRELRPTAGSEGAAIKVTVHFLEPNIEYHLPAGLIEPAACAKAIDEAMLAIVSAREPVDFPVLPAKHCRMCNFLDVCDSGRRWLIGSKAATK